ncbi:SGNH/GDSL hydrolase family protein [Nocardia sp. NPDC051052]|uniref:SGNH/GDSL hydrolase family protein n=1 Tax=Nocardia sp. NPDC051052 TaxID=3364322 RepID=UPI00379B630E
MINASRVACVTATLLLTAACSNQSTTSATSPGAPAAPGVSKVLFLGDSVAAGEALALRAAFEAGKTEFQSLAAEGGGNVVGPFSEENWKKLPDQIAAAKPTVIIYQLTTFDWGSRQEQQAAYGKLLGTATTVGARLVFVTMPPIKPDEFYQPHMAELDQAPSAARTVAAQSPAQAAMLDADSVWGSSYQQIRDGKPDRSSDGIHTCPQGAARFASWLLHELARLFPGFTPASPQTWANTGWSGDNRFKGC